MPSLGAEAEAEVAGEKPTCDGDRACDFNDEGPAAAEPSSAVVEFAIMVVVVVVDDDAVAATTVAAAGRAVDADTRLGMRLG